MVEVKKVNKTHNTCNIKDIDFKTKSHLFFQNYIDRNFKTFFYNNSISESLATVHLVQED